MYEKLCRQLRVMASTWGVSLPRDAADAIEELQGRAKVLEKIADKWCEAVPKWIPVTERLPEFDEEVLVVRHYAHRCEVVTAHIAVEVDGYSYWSKTGITHWMPLPEPPKEET